ncbi:hypothetical protein CCS92_32635, partial [Methylobacterium radiotolerans]
MDGGAARLPRRRWRPRPDAHRRPRPRRPERGRAAGRGSGLGAGESSVEAGPSKPKTTHTAPTTGRG